MSYLKRRNFSVPKKLIESLSEVLLNHCGKMVNSQCVKTALLYIQREELKQLSAHNPTIQGKPVQHQPFTSRLSTKRKRASDDIKGEEPLKLEMRRLSENQKSSFFYLSVEDENFAYDLVQELVRSFLAAEDTRIQDCASYALQETLQIYTCQSGELSQIVRPSNSLWNRFSEEIQEILVPLQHSRYIMSSNKRTSFPCPIYGSKLGSTFKDWACNWASCLLQKIKRENTARVFQSCFMIVKTM
ncbi:serine/threonine-protein kinase atr-like [Tachypleus tridentatus]|uniref:serine/threonine-protein kinase atr-like n=1 Tax=Tachypleus tridentatus TaxID=6853 RepID=UPI003FD6AD90